MIQLQVLNKILDTSDYSLIELNNLNSDYFSDFKNEFDFIVSHYNKYENVPNKETFSNKFKDFKYIKVTEGNDYLISSLVKDKAVRDMATSFKVIKQQIMSGNIDDAINLLRETSDKINNTQTLHVVDIFEDIERYDTYIDKTKNYLKYFVKTGFDELDNAIGGWDRQEELACLVARNGQGKSWVLFTFALAAANQGLRVGIYEGEMSTDRVGARLDTLYGHIPYNSIVRGNENIKIEYKSFFEKIEKMENKPIVKVLTLEGAGGYCGVNTLRAFMEQEQLDILFIDQYSLMEDDKNGKNDSEKIANIVKELKKLQRMKKKPIVVVSQQNREKNEGDGYDTTQIALSDKIGQYSTNVIFLDRDKDNKDIMRLWLTKCRDSERAGGSIAYNVDFNLGNYTYIPENQDGYEVSDDIAQRYTTQGEDVFK